MSNFKHMSDDYLKQNYVPSVYQPGIYKIDCQKLWNDGIRFLSFDIDDTIADLLTPNPPKEAKTLLEHMKAMGFTVVLLTNAWKELAEEACKDLGVDGYIARARKPETAGFAEIAERYGLESSQMGHVGNSMRADIEGGNRYGVTTCLIRRAGVSVKLVKSAVTIVGQPTKGHMIREKLLERDIWRKHHAHRLGEQYYQLGEKPEYRTV